MEVTLNHSELETLLGRALGVEVHDVKLCPDAQTVVFNMGLGLLQKIVPTAGTTIPEVPISVPAPIPVTPTEVSAEEMHRIIAASNNLAAGMVVEYMPDGEVIQRPRTEDEEGLPPGEPIEVNYR